MIGDKIKTLLEARGITQKKLAKIIDVSPATLCSYIINKRAPSLEKLELIARSLSVDLNYFANVSFNKPRKQNVSNDTKSKANPNLLVLMKNLLKGW